MALGLAIAVAGLFASAAASASDRVAEDGGIRFTTPEAAIQQGIAAYKSRNYEIAVPAFRAAKKAGHFLAPFFLARIYADGRQAYSDDARAFRLYQEIARRYLTSVRPGSGLRAKVVAASVKAVAMYKFHGLPSAGLKPDPAYAVRMLRHAADFYNDMDAQFELARLQLVGAPGLKKDARHALYRLANLADRKHPGAQARLAEQFWLGRNTAPDHRLALVYITLAQKNAPEQERLWIDDLHQQIYCGAPKEVRKQATGLVAGWRDRGLRRRVLRVPEHHLLSPLAGPVRQCRNGEPVINLVDTLEDASLETAKPSSRPARAAAPALLPADSSASGVSPLPWTGDSHNGAPSQGAPESEPGRSLVVPAN
ncbi:MAG: hypothetical protein AAFQ45_12350 [Pseudomonadota bacterium]